uniref:Putative secreted protein n=1 Tax=Ixodes ricinus TaxID=34613 RepID=A0A147BC02_IXORI
MYVMTFVLLAQFLRAFRALNDKNELIVLLPGYTNCSTRHESTSEQPHNSPRRKVSWDFLERSILAVSSCSVFFRLPKRRNAHTGLRNSHAGL